jgi:putative transposase
MSKKRHLGRVLADVSPGELRRLLEYKCPDHDAILVAVGRFYPSSKTCSCCGAVKAKLPLHVHVYDCDTCGMSLDRDVNAARNIAREAERLLGCQVQPDSSVCSVAGLRPETRNADLRPQKTSPAHAGVAAVA